MWYFIAGYFIGILTVVVRKSHIDYAIDMTKIKNKKASVVDTRNPLDIELD